MAVVTASNSKNHIKRYPQNNEVPIKHTVIKERTQKHKQKRRTPCAEKTEKLIGDKFF